MMWLRPHPPGLNFCVLSDDFGPRLRERRSVGDRGRVRRAGTAGFLVLRCHEAAIVCRRPLARQRLDRTKPQPRELRLFLSDTESRVCVGRRGLFRRRRCCSGPVVKVFIALVIITALTTAPDRLPA